MLRWNRLHVQSSFIYDLNKPPSVVIDHVSSKINKLYQTQLDADVSGLVTSAVKYVLWVLPSEYRHQRNAVEAFSLWLSLHWILKYALEENTVSGSELSTVLTRLAYSETTTPSNNKFIELAQVIYSKYLKSIAPYRNSYAKAFDKIVYWSKLYFEITLHTTSYHKMRLIQSNYMGVIWHLFLITRTPISVNSQSLKIVALALAYQEDLLTFCVGSKPNIVKLILNDNYWEGYINTISLIEHMYLKIQRAFSGQITSSLRIIQLLEGSQNWRCTHNNYKKGLKLLQAAQQKDEKSFYMQLTIR